MARPSKAEPNLKDHREKSGIVEGDQVQWAYVGVIGGVIHADRIAAVSNNRESFLRNLRETGTGQVS